MWPAGIGPQTFNMARAMFSAAPILNPTPDNGINLILDASGTVPFWSIVGFNAVDNAMLSTANYSTLKAGNFDNATLSFFPKRVFKP